MMIIMTPIEASVRYWLHIQICILCCKTNVTVSQECTPGISQLSWSVQLLRLTYWELQKLLEQRHLRGSSSIESNNENAFTTANRPVFFTVGQYLNVAMATCLGHWKLSQKYFMNWLLIHCRFFSARFSWITWIISAARSVSLWARWRPSLCSHCSLYAYSDDSWSLVRRSSCPKVHLSDIADLTLADPPLEGPEGRVVIFQKLSYTWVGVG
jgi:hypothetical protein